MGDIIINSQNLQQQKEHKKFDSDFLILLFNLIFCIEACNLSPNIMNDLIQKSLLNLKMVDWLTKELLSRECVLLILNHRRNI